MNGKALAELEKLTESDSGVDNRKLIKIAFQLMSEHDSTIAGLVKGFEGLQEKLDDLYNEKQQYHKIYPPITWLLRHKPREMLGTLVLGFILMFLMIAFAPLLGRLIWTFFGLPPLP